MSAGPPPTPAQKPREIVAGGITFTIGAAGGPGCVRYAHPRRNNEGPGGWSVPLWFNPASYLSGEAAPAYLGAAARLIHAGKDAHHDAIVAEMFRETRAMLADSDPAARTYSTPGCRFEYRLVEDRWLVTAYPAGHCNAGWAAPVECFAGSEDDPKTRAYFRAATNVILAGASVTHGAVMAEWARKAKPESPAKAHKATIEILGKIYEVSLYEPMSGILELRATPSIGEPLTLGFLAALTMDHALQLWRNPLSEHEACVVAMAAQMVVRMGHGSVTWAEAEDAARAMVAKHTAPEDDAVKVVTATGMEFWHSRARKRAWCDRGDGNGGVIEWAVHLPDIDRVPDYFEAATSELPWDYRIPDDAPPLAFHGAVMGRAWMRHVGRGGLDAAWPSARFEAPSSDGFVAEVVFSREEERAAHCYDVTCTLRGGVNRRARWLVPFGELTGDNQIDYFTAAASLIPHGGNVSHERVNVRMAEQEAERKIADKARAMGAEAVVLNREPERESEAARVARMVEKMDLPALAYKLPDSVTGSMRRAEHLKAGTLGALIRDKLGAVCAETPMLAVRRRDVRSQFMEREETMAKIEERGEWHLGGYHAGPTPYSYHGTPEVQFVDFDEDGDARVYAVSVHAGEVVLHRALLLADREEHPWKELARIPATAEQQAPIRAGLTRDNVDGVMLVHSLFLRRGCYPRILWEPRDGWWKDALLRQEWASEGDAEHVVLTNRDAWDGLLAARHVEADGAIYQINTDGDDGDWVGRSQTGEKVVVAWSRAGRRTSRGVTGGRGDGPMTVLVATGGTITLAGTLEIDTSVRDADDEANPDGAFLGARWRAKVDAAVREVVLRAGIDVGPLVDVGEGAEVPAYVEETVRYVPVPFAENHVTLVATDEDFESAGDRGQSVRMRASDAGARVTINGVQCPFLALEECGWLFGAGPNRAGRMFLAVDGLHRVWRMDVTRSFVGDRWRMAVGARPYHADGKPCGDAIHVGYLNAPEGHTLADAVREDAAVSVEFSRIIAKLLGICIGRTVGEGVVVHHVEGHPEARLLRAKVEIEMVKPDTTQWLCADPEENVAALPPSMTQPDILSPRAWGLDSQASMAAPEAIASLFAGGLGPVLEQAEAINGYEPGAAMAIATGAAVLVMEGTQVAATAAAYQLGRRSAEIGARALTKLFGAKARPVAAFLRTKWGERAAMGAVGVALRTLPVTGLASGIVRDGVAPKMRQLAMAEGFSGVVDALVGPVLAAVDSLDVTALLGPQEATAEPPTAVRIAPVSAPHAEALERHEENAPETCAATRGR